MDDLINVQQKLVPDMLEVMTSRYRVLQSIRFLQPIGRRTLASNLGVTERVLRGEVTFLHEQGLIDMSSSGMRLTQEGDRLIHTLDDVISDVSGRAELEKQLEKQLGATDVVVIPGDSDHQPWVKTELGLACVKVMQDYAEAETIIGVTGGTTLAAVADVMRPFKNNVKPLFISARGGLGEQAENQANTICTKMAYKADGHYRLLHVPDQVSEESYQIMTAEPSIHEVLQLIDSAGMIVHGIGDAKTMAERRRSSEVLLKKIHQERAVAEAFGYYFNRDGEVVHKVKTIGLQLENIYENRTVIAVAGGHSKAQAIQAYYQQGPSSILITDEGAARGILNAE
ncbi:sugar-binding transcriptional regulator [Tuberibacillus sp. Marseille-P3662]|uniref:sugar-binding transcriptional regulator n=1 Tax=Tuberibacillus sp. Marseille-P3662 TaxID=1965358 RepID=UPI000A1C9FB1|nr:sugar-binding domain-containing protein [Tuberibacillus sp. Marseille-P3662]